MQEAQEEGEEEEAGEAAGGSKVERGCQAPARRRHQEQARVAPKGLGSGLPALPLPRIPPGGLPSCSLQAQTPFMLVGQSAARAPMLAMKGDRLVRGLAGLAATFLLCR